jgi:hypothetical protein
LISAARRGLAFRREIIHITENRSGKIKHENPPRWRQVTDPEKLQDALKRGLEANRSGKPAIIDVIVA